MENALWITKYGIGLTPWLCRHDPQNPDKLISDPAVLRCGVRFNHVGTMGSTYIYAASGMTDVEVKEQLRRNRLNDSVVITVPAKIPESKCTFEIVEPKPEQSLISKVIAFFVG